MNKVALQPNTQNIVISEVLPHAPETLWKALTTGDLIGRWLMTPTGFEPVKGSRFTFQTTPAGAWDGMIHCEVLEVIHNKRFTFTWQGGHESNAGYGSRRTQSRASTRCSIATRSLPLTKQGRLSNGDWHTRTAPCERSSITPQASTKSERNVSRNGQKR
jgi:uncharacterized protein YndB with AHSA1/START domain